MQCSCVLSLVILCVCVVDLHAWWGSRSSSSFSSNYGGSSNLNKQGLTNLYNSKVTKIQSYERPMFSGLGNLFGLNTHTGVVATTENGGRWLIHKGAGYGKSSSTVVTDAKNMSNGWKITGTSIPSNQPTISDLMKAGYVNKPYGLLPGQKICWDASGNIMKQYGKRSFLF